jgi:hypothetical protein
LHRVPQLSAVCGDLFLARVILWGWSKFMLLLFWISPKTGCLTQDRRGAMLWHSPSWVLTTVYSTAYVLLASHSLPHLEASSSSHPRGSSLTSLRHVLSAIFSASSLPSSHCVWNTSSPTTQLFPCFT